MISYHVMDRVNCLRFLFIEKNFVFGVMKRYYNGFLLCRKGHVNDETIVNMFGRMYLV